MNEMMAATARYFKKQDESEANTSSSSSSSSVHSLTFDQMVIMEEMKAENLRLQYKLALLQQKSP